MIKVLYSVATSIITLPRKQRFSVLLTKASTTEIYNSKSYAVSPFTLVKPMPNFIIFSERGRPFPRKINYQNIIKKTHHQPSLGKGSQLS